METIKKPFPGIVIIIMVTVLCFTACGTGQDPKDNENMKTTNEAGSAVYQLRIYELNEHNKEQFLIRFHDHASRIMKQHGFNILNMWESNFNGSPEFVYLLRWDSEEALKAGWDKFFNDPEWIEIRDSTNEKYGMLVGNRKEDRILKQVDWLRGE